MEDGYNFTERNFGSKSNGLQVEVIKRLKEPLKDLFFSIEKGDIERVRAHIKAGTPIDEPTNLHRNLEESLTAVEYSVYCKKYEIFATFFHKGGKLTERIQKQAVKDHILNDMISGFN